MKKACQFWQQGSGAVYVIGEHAGQVSGSAVFSVYPCKWERPQLGTGPEQIEDLRCPIMSEKTIIRLRCSSLRSTFEVERRGVEPQGKFSTKSKWGHLPVAESNCITLMAFEVFVVVVLCISTAPHCRGKYSFLPTIFILSFQLKILPKKQGFTSIRAKGLKKSNEKRKREV